jgi:hypothetical protein
MKTSPSFILIAVLFASRAVSAWEGPPAVIGGGLVNLAHPVSYLDVFESGSFAANLPFDSRLRGNFLISESADETWQFNFKAESFEFPQAVPLGNNGYNTPTNLLGFDVGTIYNKKLDENRDWGLITSLGSDSDLLFNSLNEVDVSATLTYHKKEDMLHSWFFFLNESSSRSFAPWIPIPGVGYLAIYPQAHVQVFYGLPFFFSCQPGANWNFTTSYFLLTTINSELSYRLKKGKLYGSFQWTPQTWSRAYRSDVNAHIIFDQKKVLAGWQIDLEGSLFLNIAVGFAFDQRVTEAESLLSSGLVYSYLPAGGVAQIEIAHRFF